MKLVQCSFNKTNDDHYQPLWFILQPDPPAESQSTVASEEKASSEKAPEQPSEKHKDEKSLSCNTELKTQEPEHDRQKDSKEDKKKGFKMSFVKST